MFTSFRMVGVSALLLLMPASVLADAGDDLVQQQKDQLEQILIDMNKTGASLYDAFTNDPIGVVESGCLGTLRDIDFDIIPIDPTNILGPLFARIKEEMRNIPCSAVADRMSKINESLNAQLEQPHELGSPGLAQIHRVGDGSGQVPIVNVEIDEQQVASDVTQDVLGSVRVTSWSVKDNVSQIHKSDSDQRNNWNKPKNSKDVDSRIEKMLDIDQLWGANDD